ncbi:MAG TPA: type II toxin-antitoxin system VapC family toxin [Gemmataceae bacterium]|nr:type II toxin-antitoxin system VapC family toxin [Gemmataceae bacterium]
MKYVVDCSTAFKWVVQEFDSSTAIQLRNDFKAGIHELLAPDLFPTEVANALLMAERRKRIQPGDSTLFLLDILQTLPALHSALPDLLPRAHAIAHCSGASVYDCLYVALAECEGCEHVTADAKLINRLQPIFPFVISLASLP